VPSKCGDEFAPATSGAIFLQLHVFKSVRTRLGAPKGFPLVDGSDERTGCYGACGCAPFLLFSGDFGCEVAWFLSLGIVPHAFWPCVGARSRRHGPSDRFARFHRVESLHQRRIIDVVAQ
jgi:hypothetical protein